MAGGKGAARPLDPQHAAFIQGGVSVVIASGNSELAPEAARGCGCRVSRDRREVTVLVEVSRSGALLDDIAANGMVAVVFSQPSTHRTIQLKGTDAHRVPLTAADRAVASRHALAWCDDLCSIGYGRDFAVALHGRPRQLAAIRFTASAAFQQTPGPAAGQRLEP